MNQIVSLMLNDLIDIFQNKVPHYIFDKIKTYDVLSELDLQFNILFYLDNKIASCNDKRWKIHNCYYLRISKKYPDLMIFLNNNPVICIELKYFGFNSPNKKKILKDIEKLENYFRFYPTMKLGYSINFFTCSKEEYFKFNRNCRNKITDSRVKILNFNLSKYISNLENIKLSYTEYVEKLRSNLTRRSKYLKILRNNNIMKLKNDENI